MELPSLGFGGSFSSYTPPTDWGAIIGKSAEVLKMGLDIRTAIRTPAQSTLPSSLENSLTAQNTSGNMDGGGISTPILLIGGAVAVVAIVLVMKS